MRGAVGDDADFVAVVAHHLRLGNQRARRFELVRQTVHVVGVVVGPLAVLRFLVVSAAARKPRRSGMIGSRQGAVADAVAVHILVARETAGPFQVFRGQYLAAVLRLLGILERLRHPVVHSEIEVGHDEHRRLQLLGEVESVTRHAEALGHAARQQHGMTRVAVRELGHKLDVALRGARWQSGGRTHALDVPDDAGNFDVVAQSGELRHQRNSWSGSGGHGARSRPSRAQNHADGGEFVFGLHDGKSRFAISTNSVFLHVINEGLHQRRGRRNRIPRHHRDAGEHAAQRGSGVAVDDDHAGGFVHALDRERVGLGERGRGVIVTGLGGVPVEIGGFDFLGELLAQRFLHFGHVELEQLRHHPDVNHVLDQLAQLRLGADRGANLVVGHGVEGQIGAQFVQLQRLVVQHRGARGQRHGIFPRGLRIHRHQEIDFLLARDVALLAGANGVPGGQTGNVRGEHVLAGDGNAHLKNGAQQNGVGALRSRAVYGCNLDAEVVDDRLTHGARSAPCTANSVVAINTPYYDGWCGGQNISL